jgi:RimJ/RimL family protein N-acetyltransferase
MVAVMRHLFAARDLAELTADTDPRSAASIRLLTRLGFVETGRAARTLLWGDEWCDSVYFAVTRDRWDQSGVAGS